jgi:hypothetical protein
LARFAHDLFTEWRHRDFTGIALEQLDLQLFFRVS